MSYYGYEFTLMKSNILFLEREQWNYPLLEGILMAAAFSLIILSLVGQLFHSPTLQKMSGTRRLRV